MSRSAELKIEKRSGHLWITLPDAITMYDNKEIERKIGGELRDRKDHVILDFSHTSAVYSSGLGLMIRIRRFVTERGGMLSLVNVSEQVYDMFKALNIDKVFRIFATDVEFEISQDDFMDNSEQAESIGFLFVANQEGGCFKINISGEMTGSQDLSACREMQPSPQISMYLFDLSGVEIIDSTGAEVFLELTERIRAAGGICRAHGTPELKREMLTILGGDKNLTFFADEKDAFEGRNPL